jgi:hypothetical protein
VVRNPWLFMEPELSCSKLKKKHTIQKIITWQNIGLIKIHSFYLEHVSIC